MTKYVRIGCSDTLYTTIRGRIVGTMVGVHRFLQKQFMPTIFPIIPPRGFMASTRYRVSTRGCPVLHFRYKRPHYRVWLYDPTTGISHSHNITYSASMLFHGCMRTSRQTRWEVWSTATDDTYKSMPITSYVTVTKSSWNSGFDFAQWGHGHCADSSHYIGKNYTYCVI